MIMPCLGCIQGMRLRQKGVSAMFSTGYRRTPVINSDTIRLQSVYSSHTICLQSKRPKTAYHRGVYVDRENRQTDSRTQ